MSAELNRSVARWAVCDPKAMAENQSPAAIMYAFKDAKADIAALVAQRDELLALLRDTTESLCAAGPNGISQLIARNRTILAKHGDAK